MYIQILVGFPLIFSDPNEHFPDFKPQKWKTILPQKNDGGHSLHHSGDKKNLKGKVVTSSSQIIYTPKV